MNQTLKKIWQISGISLITLLVLVAAFGGVSYYLYYAPQAANLPCRGCDGEAQAVLVNGFDLYYRAIGRDQAHAPVVLLHGGPGQSSQTLKDGFDFLADNYRVIFREFNELIFKANLGRLYDARRADLLHEMGYASFAVNRDITSSTMGGNFDQQLSQLTVPTLIIFGKADNSPFTNESVAKHFHAVLPNSTLVQMEHSGHWPYLEERALFQAVLTSFFRNLTSIVQNK